MIGVPAYILNLRPSILKPNFQSVDIPWLKVKPLYAFIEKLPRLAFLIEFKVALLLNKSLASLCIGAYDEGFYITVPAASDGGKRGGLRGLTVLVLLETTCFSSI